MTSVDDEGIVAIGTPFRTIAAVAADEPHRVVVTWKDNGEKTVVDLAPTLFTFKLYAPLRNDRALFETVHVVDDLVVAWGDDDAIDMHALELERLAGETMETTDFRAFLEEMRWTRDAAAAQLGMSRRTVGYYATGTSIPRYIALACAQLRSLKSSATGGTWDHQSAVETKQRIVSPGVAPSSAAPTARTTLGGRKGKRKML